MNSDSRKVLFISPGPNIAVPATGEGARLHHLSRELSNRGWEVIALVPAAENTTPRWVSDTYTYEQWGTPFLTDLNPSFLRSLREVVSEHSLDVIHSSKGVCTARGVVGRDENPKIVYAAQNVEAAHARGFIDPTLPFYKRVLGPKLIPFVERCAVACADFITTVSDPDRVEFCRRYEVPVDRISSIPTGTTPIEPAELPDSKAVRKRFEIDAETVAVFHGSYDHAPNREAVRFITEQLAPSLVAENIDIQILLCGKGMPNCEDPMVRTLGYVEDLFAVLNAADLAVVPITQGGGTNTKVYDYLSVGLPLVTTPHAIRGIALDEGTHALTRALGDQFIEGTRTLAMDDEARNRMSAAISAWSADRTWAASGEKLDKAYRSLQ